MTKNIQTTFFFFEGVKSVVAFFHPADQQYAATSGNCSSVQKISNS